MYLHFFLIYVFHLRQQQVYDREHLASEGGVFPVCLLFFGFFFKFTAHPTGSSKLCPLNRSVVRHTLPNHTYSGELNRKGHMVTGQGSMYNQRITLQQRNRRQKPCQSKILMFCLFTCRTIYRDGNRYIAIISLCCFNTNLDTRSYLLSAYSILYIHVLYVNTQKTLVHSVLSSVCIQIVMQFCFKVI